jgi:curved DNA-binding protein CbpA
VEADMMGSGITWYDVLGVMPGAEALKIKRKYEDKASLLRPDLIWGAPPDVVTAVRQAQELLDTAWEVLGDPASRKRYDEAVGLRRSGGGPGQPGTGIESAGLALADPGIIGELPGVNVAGGLPVRVWPARLMRLACAPRNRLVPLGVP